jgi:hypothetical protein
MTDKKTLRSYLREDKFIITEDARGQQTLYKLSENTKDHLKVFIAENGLQMKNYFRTRNIKDMPEIIKEESDDVSAQLKSIIRNVNKETAPVRKEKAKAFKAKMAGIPTTSDSFFDSEEETDYDAVEAHERELERKEGIASESTEVNMTKKLEETSMFQGGPDNATTGNSSSDYRSYLAAELFGAPTFANQVPTADTHQEQVVIQGEQATEGLGDLRGVGAPAPNMYEQSISTQLIKLTKNLFRAGKLNEAAKIADAIEQPQNAAAFVLEAAMACDGSVDEALTEELYQTAAILNGILEG